MEDSEIPSPQTLQLLAAAAMEQEAADETAAKEAPREAQQGPEADARARERKGGSGRLRGGASGNNLGKARPPKTPELRPALKGQAGRQTPRQPSWPCLGLPRFPPRLDRVLLERLLDLEGDWPPKTGEMPPSVPPDLQHFQAGAVHFSGGEGGRKRGGERARAREASRRWGERDVEIEPC